MVLKEMILYISTLGGCDGLERTNFNSFHLGGVVVLKELNLLILCCLEMSTSMTLGHILMNFIIQRTDY